MKRISFKDSKGLNLTREVLAGRKTITRRAIALPNGWEAQDVEVIGVGLDSLCRQVYLLRNRQTNERCDMYPKYQYGDVVAIQQPYREIVNESAELHDILLDQDGQPDDEFRAGWNNKMFVRAALMPHHIKITDVRCERLQDIPDEDCLREGIEWLPDGVRLKPYAFYDTRIKTQDGYGWYRDYDTPREAFAALIDKVSGRGTWKSNPIVWVYEFELVN